MRFLGLDLGEKRIGIAISDQTGLLASPLKVIEEKNLEKELKIIIEEEHIKEMVIGFPKHMNNTIGDSAKKAIKIKNKLEKKFKIKTFLQDERRTTIVAEEQMKEMNLKKKRKKVDMMAATLILQSFLDRRDNDERKNDF